MQHITKIYRSKKIHRVEKVTQTGKYKLNLIEPTDPFLPDALNQNTQKIEDAMTAHEEGVEQRLTVLEARRFACGCYSGGDRSRRFIPLPFKPKAVLIGIPAVVGTAPFALGTQDYGEDSYLKLTENGFYVNADLNGSRLNFLAFA